MAYNHSYTITVDNNLSEKETISFLLSTDINFINPDKESRKIIMNLLKIDKKFARAFDLILIPGHTNLEQIITLQNVENIILIELKTTKKRLLNNPKGFFFAATESEFKLGTQLGDNYKFCFVSLHPESKGYTLLTFDELNLIIKTKRIQFQINL